MKFPNDTRNKKRHTKRELRLALTIGSGSRSIKVAALGLAAAIGLTSVSLSANATPPSQPQSQQKAQVKLQLQNRTKVNLSKLTPKDREDILLVMPNANADQDDLAEALTENQGTVIGQMGQGPMTVLIVKVPRGKAAEAEKKMNADKQNFSTVNANRREAETGYIPRAPGFSALGVWHFDRLNMSDAWELRDKNNSRRLQGLIVMDSGYDASYSGTDVTGKYKSTSLELKLKMAFGQNVGQLKDYIVQQGNHVVSMTYDAADHQGHGTHVATAAIGSDSSTGSIGMCPGTQVCPIRIADGPYASAITTDDLAVTSAMECAFDMADAPVNNVRIINISYANMFDANAHKVLHELFKYWYYQKDGLVFVSAGNDGRYLGIKDQPYLNVVSAMGHVKGMHLANVTADSGKTPWSSAYGPVVDFTAPGEDIQVTDLSNRGGKNVSVDGTSFASPIVAGIAQMLLSVNPNLKNYQVEAILRRSAVNTTSGRNNQFGWGMPDAAKAVRMAIATK